MGPRLNEWNEGLKNVEHEDGSFVPDFSSIPSVRVSVHLDFSTADTMEGKVKARCLENVKRSSGNTQNANAHVTAIVGVAGIGGLGKKTALIELSLSTCVTTPSVSSTEIPARAGHRHELGVQNICTSSKTLKWSIIIYQAEINTIHSEEQSDM